LYSLQFSRPSCLRRSVAGISPQRHGFDPRPVHVRTVGDSITGTGFSPSTSVFLHQYHSTNVPYPFIQIPPTLFCLSVLLLSPVSTIPTTVPYPLIHLPPTLYNVSLPVPQFSPVSIIPPMLHTHSFTYHPRYIMFLSQYLSFPLSVSFHQCSIPIHSPTTRAI